jgi:hypothetical protein
MKQNEGDMRREKPGQGWVIEYQKKRGSSNEYTINYVGCNQ